MNDFEFDFKQRDTRPKVPATTQEWHLEDLFPFIKTLDPGELLTLRDYIDTNLPVKSLKDMDLEHELVIQFQVAKTLQSTTLASEEEANRKVLTVNACAAVLQQLVKLQSELHTAERFKAMENIMIKSLKLMPPEVAADFVEKYEALSE